jgi:hypothetical protein
MPPLISLTSVCLSLCWLSPSERDTNPSIHPHHLWYPRSSALPQLAPICYLRGGRFNLIQWTSMCVMYCTDSLYMNMFDILPTIWVFCDKCSTLDGTHSRSSVYRSFPFMLLSSVSIPFVNRGNSSFTGWGDQW